MTLTGIVLPPSKPLGSNEYARRYIGACWTSFAGASLADFPKVVLDAYSKALNLNTGMYISGPTGVGKTRLLVALFLDLADRGADAALYTYNDILDDIRADFGRERDDKPVIYPYYLAKPVLFIDDIGAGRTTQWAAERMYRLLDERLKARLPTYFTSNYGLTQLGGVLNECYEVQTKVSTRDGDRIVSRIGGACVGVKLVGKDRRLER